MNSKHYDIVIIGAGPAGCAAALGLGRSGLKVAVLDKAKFPRDKICGDAIPGPAIKTLSKAFPFFGKDFQKLKQKHRIKMSSITLDNGRTINYSWILPAYNIKRGVFDQFLIDLVRKHTNVKILTGFKVASVEHGSPMIIHSEVDTKSISATMVIGSDGAASITSKCFGHQVYHKTDSVMASRAYFKGLNLNEETNFFYVLKKYLPGYFWAFPLGGGVFNVGVGVKTRKDGKAPFSIKDVFQEFVEKDTLIEKIKNWEQIGEVKGAIIPIGGYKGTYGGDNFLLTGDAAHLSDPLQGHGIDKAIVSGLLAAHQSMKCFKENDFSAEFNTDYDTMINVGVGKELRKNRQRQIMLSNFPFLLSFYSRIKK